MQIAPSSSTQRSSKRQGTGKIGRVFLFLHLKGFICVWLVRAAIVFQSGEYFQGQFGQPPESEYANSALSELGIMWARALSKLPARASLTYILSLIAVFLI